MRRKDRQITQKDEIIRILSTCKVCRLAMQDTQGLYIVPLNYGYTFEEDQLILYFHSAKEGRKIMALKENPHLAFEMDGNHQLITADQACRHSYLYSSVIGNGKVEWIEETSEQAFAMNQIMFNQSGRRFEISEQALEAVNLFKVIVQDFTVKEHHK